MSRQALVRYLGYNVNAATYNLTTFLWRCNACQQNTLYREEDRETDQNSELKSLAKQCHGKFFFRSKMAFLHEKLAAFALRNSRPGGAHLEGKFLP